MMKTHDNGCGFTVCYSRDDADRFARGWPCSTVQGRGSFQFDGTGNLIDVGGSAEHHDGPDWLAFSQDCYRYGLTRIPILRHERNRYETRDGTLATEGGA